MATVTSVGAFEYLAQNYVTAPNAFYYLAESDIADLGSESTLWRRKPNWRTDPQQSTEMLRDIIDLSACKVQIDSLGDALVHSATYMYTNVSKSDEYELLEFLQSRQGRLKRFWSPIWRNDLELYEEAFHTEASLTVVACGYADTLQGHERVYIEFIDGSFLTRHVTAAIDNGDGTETLTVATPLERDVSPADIAYFGRLILCRFDADEIEFQHVTADVSETSLRLVELVKEYDDIEAGS